MSNSKQHTQKGMHVIGKRVCLAATTIEIAIADNVPDAEFICEAFNVSYESGLSPSELFDYVGKLEWAVNNAIGNMELMGKEQPTVAMPLSVHSYKELLQNKNNYYFELLDRVKELEDEIKMLKEETIELSDKATEKESDIKDLLFKIHG